MKLSYLTILTVLLSFGCAQKPTNINGTYKSDVSYFESLIRSNDDVQESYIETMKSLQPELIIDYPKCTFIQPTSSSAGRKTEINEHSIVGTIEKINEELYLFIKTNTDGTKFKDPMYLDSSDGSIYTSAKKFIKR